MILSYHKKATRDSVSVYGRDSKSKKSIIVHKKDQYEDSPTTVRIEKK